MSWPWQWCGVSEDDEGDTATTQMFFAELNVKSEDLVKRWSGDDLSKTKAVRLQRFLKWFMQNRIRLLRGPVENCVDGLSRTLQHLLNVLKASLELSADESQRNPQVTELNNIHLHRCIMCLMFHYVPYAKEEHAAVVGPLAEQLNADRYAYLTPLVCVGDRTVIVQGGCLHESDLTANCIKLLVELPCVVTPSAALTFLSDGTDLFIDANKAWEVSRYVAAALYDKVALQLMHHVSVTMRGDVGAGVIENLEGTLCETITQTHKAALQKKKLDGYEEECTQPALLWAGALADMLTFGKVVTQDKPKDGIVIELPDELGAEECAWYLREPEDSEKIAFFPPKTQKLMATYLAELAQFKVLKPTELASFLEQASSTAEDIKEKATKVVNATRIAEVVDITGAVSEEMDTLRKVTSQIRRFSGLSPFKTGSGLQPYHVRMRAMLACVEAREVVRSRHLTPEALKLLNNCLVDCWSSEQHPQVKTMLQNMTKYSGLRNYLLLTLETEGESYRKGINDLMKKVEDLEKRLHDPCPKEVKKCIVELLQSAHGAIKAYVGNLEGMEAQLGVTLHLTQDIHRRVSLLDQKLDTIGDAVDDLRSYFNLMRTLDADLKDLKGARDRVLGSAGDYSFLQVSISEDEPGRSACKFIDHCMEKDGGGYVRLLDAMGAEHFLKEVERSLWGRDEILKSFQPAEEGLFQDGWQGVCLPLFADLTDIKEPKEGLISKILEHHGFTQINVEELKKKTEEGLRLVLLLSNHKFLKMRYQFSELDGDELREWGNPLVVMCVSDFTCADLWELCPLGTEEPWEVILQARVWEDGKLHRCWEVNNAYRDKSSLSVSELERLLGDKELGAELRRADTDGDAEISREEWENFLINDEEANAVMAEVDTVYQEMQAMVRYVNKSVDTVKLTFGFACCFTHARHKKNERLGNAEMLKAWLMEHFRSQLHVLRKLHPSVSEEDLLRLCFSYNESLSLEMCNGHSTTGDYTARCDAFLRKDHSEHNVEITLQLAKDLFMASPVRHAASDERKQYRYIYQWVQDTFVACNIRWKLLQRPVQPLYAHVFTDYFKHMGELDELRDEFRKGLPAMVAAARGVCTDTEQKARAKLGDVYHVAALSKKQWDVYMDDLMNFPGVLDVCLSAFAASDAEDGKRFRHMLYAMVELSKLRFTEVPAAAAITILAAARESFAGMDLRGVRVAGAHLERAIFDRADCKGSTLELQHDNTIRGAHAEGAYFEPGRECREYELLDAGEKYLAATAYTARNGNECYMFVASREGGDATRIYFNRLVADSKEYQRDVRTWPAGVEGIARIVEARGQTTAVTAYSHSGGVTYNFRPLESTKEANGTEDGEGAEAEGTEGAEDVGAGDSEGAEGVEDVEGTDVSGASVVGITRNGTVWYTKEVEGIVQLIAVNTKTYCWTFPLEGNAKHVVVTLEAGVCYRVAWVVGRTVKSKVCDLSTAASRCEAVPLTVTGEVQGLAVMCGHILVWYREEKRGYCAVVDYELRDTLKKSLIKLPGTSSGSVPQHAVSGSVLSVLLEGANLYDTNQASGCDRVDEDSYILSWYITEGTVVKLCTRRLMFQATDIFASHARTYVVTHVPNNERQNEAQECKLITMPTQALHDFARFVGRVHRVLLSDDGTMLAVIIKRVRGDVHYTCLWYDVEKGTYYKLKRDEEEPGEEGETKYFSKLEFAKENAEWLGKSKKVLRVVAEQQVGEITLATVGGVCGALRYEARDFAAETDVVDEGGKSAKVVHHGVTYTVYEEGDNEKPGRQALYIKREGHSSANVTKLFSSLRYMRVHARGSTVVIVSNLNAKVFTWHCPTETQHGIAGTEGMYLKAFVKSFDRIESEGLASL